MKYFLYSMRDDLTGFLNLTVDVSDDTAIRAFSNACKDKNSLMYANPSDFRLYRCGSWDSETGVVVSEDPALVCQAIDFVKGDN